jgi:hypothetical protein
MQFLEQFLHPLDIGRELFWILLCIGFVNLQCFLECPPGLFCLVLITIKNSQVVECQRDVRQIDFRIFLRQLTVGLQRFIERLSGFLQPVLGVIENPQIVERCRDVRQIGPRIFLL